MNDGKSEARVIFIAYNTDSIVWELTLQKQNKYSKLSKSIQKDSEIGSLMKSVYSEKGEESTHVDTISDNNKSLRIKVFEKIYSFFKCTPAKSAQHKDVNVQNRRKNNSDFEYHIDILPQQNQSQNSVQNTPPSPHHYTNNKQAIKDCIGVLFVIADEEISFWQLQEAYFASFYNKPILYVSTEQFLKLVAKRRLRKFIVKNLKYNDKYTTEERHPSPAQRTP